MADQSAPTLFMTGATGFVGGYLCRALRQAYPTSRLYFLARGSDEVVDGWGAVEAELTDHDAVRRVVSSIQPDLVLHLAAQSSVGASFNHALETWQVNLVGTMALAGALSDAAPSATLLFASSGEVYGRSFGAEPLREDAIPQPMTPYSMSKWSAERVLQDILGPGNRLIVTRSFNHTGPGQSRNFVLPSFAAQIAEVELGLRAPCISVGNLAASRDFLGVGDVVDAYVKLLLAAAELPRVTVVNVSSGHGIPVREYFDTMLDLATCPIEAVIDPARMRPSDVSYSSGNNEFLKSIIDWSPTTTKRELCYKLLEHWRSVVSPAAS